MLKRYPNLNIPDDFDGEECLKANRGIKTKLGSYQNDNRYKGKKNDENAKGEMLQHLQPALVAMATLTKLPQLIKQGEKLKKSYEEDGANSRSNFFKQNNYKDRVMYKNVDLEKPYYKRDKYGAVKRVTGKRVRYYSEEYHNLNAAWKEKKNKAVKEQEKKEKKVKKTITELTKNFPGLFESVPSDTNESGVTLSSYARSFTKSIYNTRGPEGNLFVGGLADMNFFGHQSNDAIVKAITDSDDPNSAIKEYFNAPYSLEKILNSQQKDEKNWLIEHNNSMKEQLEVIENSIEKICEGFTDEQYLETSKNCKGLDDSDCDEDDIGTLHQIKGLNEYLISAVKSKNEAQGYRVNQCLLLDKNPPSKGGVSLTMVGGIVLSGVGAIVSLSGVGAPIGIGLSAAGGVLLGADIAIKFNQANDNYDKNKGLYRAKIVSPEELKKSFDQFDSAKNEIALEVLFAASGGAISGIRKAKATIAASKERKAAKLKQQNEKEQAENEAYAEDTRRANIELQKNQDNKSADATRNKIEAQTKASKKRTTRADKKTEKINTAAEKKKARKKAKLETRQRISKFLDEGNYKSKFLVNDNGNGLKNLEDKLLSFGPGKANEILEHAATLKGEAQEKFILLASNHHSRTSLNTFLKRVKKDPQIAAKERLKRLAKLDKKLLSLPGESKQAIALAREKSAIYLEKVLAEHGDQITIKNFRSTKVYNHAYASTRAGNVVKNHDNSFGFDAELKKGFSICRGAGKDSAPIGSYFVSCKSKNYNSSKEFTSSYAAPNEYISIYRYDLEKNTEVTFLPNSAVDWGKTDKVKNGKYEQGGGFEIMPYQKLTEKGKIKEVRNNMAHSGNIVGRSATLNITRTKSGNAIIDDQASIRYPTTTNTSQVIKNRSQYAKESQANIIKKGIPDTLEEYLKRYPNDSANETVLRTARFNLVGLRKGLSSSEVKLADEIIVMTNKQKKTLDSKRSDIAKKLKLIEDKKVKASDIQVNSSQIGKSFKSSPIYKTYAEIKRKEDFYRKQIQDKANSPQKRIKALRAAARYQREIKDLEPFLYGLEYQLKKLCKPKPDPCKKITFIPEV
jgi:hypothetical protein